MSYPIDEYRPSGPGGAYSPVAVAPDPAGLEHYEEEYRPTPLTPLPVLLFLATCYTTYEVGGPWYCIPLMLTLLCHEFGHFIQARRYRVSASWPFFIPVPFPPLGTMGAVIGMRGHMGDRRALFDIGISGPLAGLVPALIFSYVGLTMSQLVKMPPNVRGGLGEPLLFQWLCDFIFGPRAPGEDIILHPLAYAGWVGIFITALNLIPIGQLDGGHVLYALLRGKAHFVAQLFLAGAVVGVILTGNWGWSLMLMLLFYMGPNHPPTANDEEPLGTGRTVLGWVTLLFMIVGFTPQPFLH